MKPLLETVYKCATRKNEMSVSKICFIRRQKKKNYFILTFPVTLAIPSFNCERSADVKLPEAAGNEIINRGIFSQVLKSNHDKNPKLCHTCNNFMGGYD